jgi:hypothetical protein
MKIAFFGDSFSSNTEGYPGMLCKHYGAEYENRSLAGSGLDYCYLMLMDYFEKNPPPDVAVITVSSGDRLYHDDHVIVLSGVSTYDQQPAYPELQKAAIEYYSHIHSNMSVHIKSSMFCNALVAFTLQYPSTKFIILPCFRPFPWTYIGNYVSTGPRLMNFAEMEADLMAKEVNGELTNRNNHLTLKQNITLALTIIDIIDNKYVYNIPQACDIDLSKTY